MHGNNRLTFCKCKVHVLWDVALSMARARLGDATLPADTFDPYRPYEVNSVFFLYSLLLKKNIFVTS